MFKTNPMTRNLPDLITKSDLIQLNNNLQLCKKIWMQKPISNLLKTLNKK